MEYIGIFTEDYFYLDGQKLKILISHTEDDVEIIIRYDEEHPFLIKEIGIFLDNRNHFGHLYRMYNVWKYESFATDDIECIAIAKHFATQVSKFLRDTLRYFKEN